MRPVLHRAAQPIAVSEFRDALYAAAPPRFPHKRCIARRRVGLAVSGGVDSMALAFLCAQLRRVDPHCHIADAPIAGFLALVVDHRLRDGSAAEAHAVAAALRTMGHRTQVLALPVSSWQDLPPGASPETIARRLRYRYLGLRLAHSRIISLLLAHHADDQYETVLMRLLTGYGLHGGIRGLRGMRPAADIPECRGLYGVHQSGLGDDQRTTDPYLPCMPSRRDRRRMQKALHEDVNISAANLEPPLEFLSHFPEFPPNFSPDSPPLLRPLESEDLGIFVYRPLLSFPKARLLATCEANNIPWFQDHTNFDPSLTLRNAIRHLARHHTLPTALQPRTVLHLSARCNATAAAHEAEARRLIIRFRVLYRFSPNAGTAVIRLPLLRARPRTRPFYSASTSFSYAHASKAHRRRHLRTIAALVIQHLLRFVTPEDHVTPVTQLMAVVDTLFPGLTACHPTAESKAFTICGVHFVPFRTSSPGCSMLSSWLLARSPSPSGKQPAITFSVPTRYRNLPEPPALPTASFPQWCPWSCWHLYDGRFWIRLRTRLRTPIELRPFAAEHAKPLRQALSHRDDLNALLAILKKHAPGKARYTLPALYTTGEGGGARLVVLPTLTIHIAGIEDWLQWEVRYRKVDTELLASSGVKPWA